MITITKADVRRQLTARNDRRSGIGDQGKKTLPATGRPPLQALEGDLGEAFGGGEEGEALAGGGLEFVEGAKFVIEGKLVEIKERAGEDVRI